MSIETIFLLAVLFFCSATLYSAVGHAGASGYLAVMAFVSVNPAIMKPTALVLNILVATIATVRYRAADRDVLRQAWPFIVGSVPLAFLGGAIHLSPSIYRPIVGVVLLIAAVRLLWTPEKHDRTPEVRQQRIPPVPATIAGGGIGFLSGLAGTGGGIFLSPLLLLTGWAEARPSAAIATIFILTNSVAGLLGNVASVRSLPGALPLWLVAALLGGLLGTEIGSRWAGNSTIQRLLALVLFIAGVKFLLT